VSRPRRPRSMLEAPRSHFPRRARLTVTGAQKAGNDWRQAVDQKAKILATVDDMTNAFHRGDIDGIMRSYENGAVVVGEPGQPLSGTPALRAMFAGFIGAKARFTFLGHEVIHAEDVALHLTPWRMAGVAPDGAAIAASGLSVAVLRRQPDGRWLMVIDDPYGDALLNSPKSR
jgi:ketosteroid isomerase-like protein